MPPGPVLKGPPPHPGIYAPPGRVRDHRESGRSSPSCGASCACYPHSRRGPRVQRRL